MRIIHTSDWHLGQNFYTKSRGPEHQFFLNWLLDIVKEQRIDAIIVAGDIFDTGSPPSYAREIYNQFIVKLRITGCQLIILAGNHDSVAMLNESRDLLACLNTHVIASAVQAPAPQALELKCQNGIPGAILCPIPFLRPRDLLYSQAGQSSADKQQALIEAIAGHYRQCYDAALALRADRNLPIIATGHLTTVGVTKSEAERDIYIGTLDAFPAQYFPPADYIALGHIHRAQSVSTAGHIRYSGSPIPLSFDENGKTKSVYLVEFSGSKLVRLNALPIPISQPLATIKGSLSEIEQQLTLWQNAPEMPITWLDIEITTDEYLHNMQHHIQQICDTIPVEVLRLHRSRGHHERRIAGQHKETLSELSIDEVFERRLMQEEPDEERTQRIRHLFARAVDSLQQMEESA